MKRPEKNFLCTECRVKEAKWGTVCDDCLPNIMDLEKALKVFYVGLHPELRKLYGRERMLDKTPSWLVIPFFLLALLSFSVSVTVMNYGKWGYSIATFVLFLVFGVLFCKTYNALTAR